ncbi:hypothetical protein CJ030_MR2G016366 [Morella rubra]|uniref:Uncharacterized protein n=1 Tax=Morella rubra TaxID=262757 RepID=A0A6A1WKV4_9ROSI|nr:hypothetical protein CJ030_MR2G016366 [Morella rubra]
MDPSSSIEAQASMNSNLSEATRTIIGMDPDLYNAAANGKFDVFEDIQEPLDLLRTPTENTILHIYLTTLVTESGSSMNFVEKVLHKCPSLLRQTNANGETLLHIAARYGHSVIVDFLIERARILDQDLESGIEPVREMVKTTNKEKDTALHEAVRYNNFEVGETCGGPLGRTALHAAVLNWNDSAHRGNSATLEVIISSCPDCCELVDNRGCNALHTAILGGYRAKDIVGIILKKSSLSNLLNEKDVDGNTPAHHQKYITNIFQLIKNPRVDSMAFNGQNLNVVGAIVNYSEEAVGQNFVSPSLTDSQG